MSDLKPKLFAALDKIGKTNGHAAPVSQDPACEALHEYHVTTLAESYFKKRRDNAKKVVAKLFTAVHNKKIDKAIAMTVENSVGCAVDVLSTEHYTLGVDLKAGASFFDVSLLKVELLTKHKMKTVEVEALIERCTNRRAPSQTWRVTEI